VSRLLGVFHCPDGGDVGHVGQLLCGAFEAAGEGLKNFDRDFGVFANYIFHITSVVFCDDGGGACFDCAAAWLTEDVAHFAKNGAGIHEHVEHDVVFVDFDDSFF